MGALDRDLKQTLRRDGVYLLAPSALLYLNSYTAQAHVPKHGAAHSGFVPPTSVINKDSAHSRALRPV